MVSKLDELIKDINSYVYCKITFYRHSGPELEIQTFNFENLNVEKDANNKVWINNEFYVSDKYKIIKIKEPENTSRAVYQITKGNVKLMEIYLH